MKTKNSLAIFCLSGVLCLCGCGTNSASSSNGEVSENETEETGAVEEKTETGLLDKKQINEATAWFRNDNAAIATGLYQVGNDLKPGSYVYSCDSDGYGTRLTVFENMDTYLKYHKMSRSTYGEEDAAIEENCLFSEYVYSGRQGALNLQEGYILLVDGDAGTLNENGNTPSATKISLTRTAAEGLYFPGDLEPGTYMVTGIDNTYQTLIGLFANKEDYEGFKKEEQMTMGQYSAAFEKWALFNDFVGAGETLFLNVTDESIVLIDYASCQFDKVDMAWD